ncbi:TlpA family protein disulfide reductase, partial [Neisseria cinerea]|uniref:TlpA family protein disulfide reductase n=1 Tax=Neisseria cinerea TaxID=483 RepID=UPI00396A5B6D
MKKKLLSGIKFDVQTALVFLLVSLCLDWMRKPDEPDGAAGRPLTLLSGRQLTWGQFSRDRTVLVYFWGSWCGVCRYQYP